MIAAEPKTTGQYQPYPEYKDSGVEWYKKIPAGWNIERFKFAVRKLESGTSVNAVDTPAEASQIGVLKTSAVYTGVFRHSENKAVVESELIRVSCPVQKGCLIVSRMNTPDLVGAAGLVAETIDNLYLPDRLWQVHLVEKYAKFFHYWTLTPEYRNQVRLVCSGTSSSMQNLSQEQFLNFLVPSPSDDEKNSIAAFLDYETARIDRLITQQQRLIELLKEKRQAVISHAVTKGLNPNVPMKDSGVEWLGQVPEHWKVGALRWYLRVSSGEYLSNKDFELEPSESAVYPVIGGNGVMGYSSCKNQLSPLVVGRVGALCGNVHLIDSDCWVTDNALLIRLSWQVEENFALHYLKALNLNKLANQNTQPLITGTMIKDQYIVLPPLHEQADITDFIDKVERKFELLITKVEQAISLMQERRIALISAAVTGKIDLRGWTPPAEEVAA
ncbi:restriction endonuclease subunit S [Aeromonas media]|uniref:restriction endonuclease subunit S n=1 Tax=Aeromonas media TaxID=651 RepID=UPI00148AEE80|nr:restriction endonuclease subunit S [Aeromonas media]QJT27857.1 restriction endonuclease subunit S [Aeromonas media]